jgi:hypothetical protein
LAFQKEEKQRFETNRQFIVIYCNPVLQRWLADVWKCTVDV